MYYYGKLFYFQSLLGRKGVKYYEIDPYLGVTYSLNNSSSSTLEPGHIRMKKQKWALDTCKSFSNIEETFGIPSL